MVHESIPEDMYREHILELYKSPSNFGTLKNANKKHTEYNTVCGDEITVELIVKNRIVKDVKFNGSGCVISLVAASLLTDKIKGMSFNEVKKISSQEMLELLGVKLTLSRVKCGLLALEAAKGALK